ncbi:MAG: PDZ domain-containing protein [Lachnospiraceae bacterium]|nr:PDZ domain-containing protein [Lachnospiraceae bacterium]MBR6156048.1 PDZ domain-containing protein [Lachnospiraceae bacterium]
MEKKDNNGRSFWVGVLTGCIVSAFVAVIVLCISIYRQRMAQQEPAAIEVAVPTQQQSRDSGLVRISPGKVPDGSVLQDKEVIGKIGALESIIDESFIDSVSDNAIENGIYSGIMEALDDPYAEYYTPEEWIEMQNDTQGIYYGIGAYLVKDLETLYPRITGVIKNTPALESGLLEDDYIVEIDGTDVYDMDLSEVVSMIRGPEGTKVHLTIVRGEVGDREELEYDVERRKVETPTVEYENKGDGIAYIAIGEFDVVTIDQFKEALDQAKADQMKGLVLDLRSNPGGSLGACVQIARMILPKGTIVYTEDKNGDQDIYESDGTQELDVPMVVLVNGNSASAAEILAGAIKDYDKGVLLGTTTYGKGIVQRIFTLTDGSAVKLTISHYYTPLGNDIHKVGIVPDEELKFDGEAYREDGTDNQLDRAIEILNEKIQ